MTDKMTFEAALEELQKTVKRLESGDLPLEEALAAFEGGVKLVRHCQESLQQAEKKVELLTRINTEGQVETQKFEP